MSQNFTCPQCKQLVPEHSLTMKITETMIGSCPHCNTTLRTDSHEHFTNSKAIELEDVGLIEEWISGLDIGFVKVPDKPNEHRWSLIQSDHQMEIEYRPSDGRFVLISRISTRFFEKLLEQRDTLPEVCASYGVQWGATSAGSSSNWRATQIVSTYCLTAKMFTAIAGRLRDAANAVEGKLRDLP